MTEEEILRASYVFVYIQKLAKKIYDKSKETGDSKIKEAMAIMK